MATRPRLNLTNGHPNDVGAPETTVTGGTYGSMKETLPREL
jgi:hypothetical protein